MSEPPVQPNAGHILSDDSDSETDDEVVFSSVPDEVKNMDDTEGVETDIATSEVSSDSRDNYNSSIESTQPIPAPQHSKRDSKCHIRYAHGLSAH